MNLTKEQQSIIESTLHSFKINAVAGSGKTTTLIEYAKKNSHLKTLYLAYNKSLQLSIQKDLIKNGLHNVKVSTIHSLAYNKIGAYKFKLVSELKIDTLQNFISKKNEDELIDDIEYFYILKELYNFYCNSSIINIDSDLLLSFKTSKAFGAKLLEVINFYENRILKDLKLLLTNMKQGKFESTHDFYLKLFSLTKTLSSDLGYELILVDEAQDMSDVMYSIINSQECKKVYVGDSFQQIYSFRYANNALEKIDLPTLYLTRSFRFGNNIAKKIASLLNGFYSEFDKKLVIFGNENNSNEFVDFEKPFCIISRTTFGLLKNLVNYLSTNKTFYFEGGYSSYSFMNSFVFSLFYLKHKKYEKISDEEIKEFKSYYEFEEFAKDTKNQDYLNIIKFIDTYDSDIFNINKKIKEKVTLDKKDADIIFTTTHKAKGLEFDQIVMADDFISKKDLLNDKLSNDEKIEELNIYYVAASRGKKGIKFSSLESNNTQSSSSKFDYKQKKQDKLSKLKELQKQWLENNKVKVF